MRSGSMRNLHGVLLASRIGKSDIEAHGCCRNRPPHRWRVLNSPCVGLCRPSHPRPAPRSGGLRIELHRATHRWRTLALERRDSIARHTEAGRLASHPPLSIPRPVRFPDKRYRRAREIVVPQGFTPFVACSRGDTPRKRAPQARLPMGMGRDGHEGPNKWPGI